MLWFWLTCMAPLLFFALAFRAFMSQHGTAVDRNIFEFTQGRARDLARDMLHGDRGPAQKKEALQLIRALEFFAARGLKLTDEDNAAISIMQRSGQ
jgi:hypothetical protein